MSIRIERLETESKVFNFVSIDSKTPAPVINWVNSEETHIRAVPDMKAFVIDMPVAYVGKAEEDLAQGSEESWEELQAYILQIAYLTSKLVERPLKIPSAGNLIGKLPPLGTEFPWTVYLRNDAFDEVFFNVTIEKAP